jgi:hypothetical protein
MIVGTGIGRDQGLLSQKGGVLVSPGIPIQMKLQFRGGSGGDVAPDDAL